MELFPKKPVFFQKWWLNLAKTCPKNERHFPFFQRPTWRGRNFDRRLTATFLPGFSCWKSAKTFCNWNRPLAIGQFCFIHLLKISDGQINSSSQRVWKIKLKKHNNTGSVWSILQESSEIFFWLSSRIRFLSKSRCGCPEWKEKNVYMIYVYSHKCRTNNHSSVARDAWFHTRIIRGLAEEMSTWHHILNHERMPLPLVHHEIIVYHNVITSWNLNT